MEGRPRRLRTRGRMGQGNREEGMNLSEVVRSRRSVRRFKDRPVPRESILRLLDLARWAPCASECWRFVVVQEAERKQRLAEAARQQWIAAAPVIIVVGADFGIPAGLSRRWDADHLERRKSPAREDSRPQVGC